MLGELLEEARDLGLGNKNASAVELKGFDPNEISSIWVMYYKMAQNKEIETNCSAVLEIVHQHLGPFQRGLSKHPACTGCTYLSLVQPLMGFSALQWAADGPCCHDHWTQLTSACISLAYLAVCQHFSTDMWQSGNSKGPNLSIHGGSCWTDQLKHSCWLHWSNYCRCNNAIKNVSKSIQVLHIYWNLIMLALF